MKKEEVKKELFKGKNPRTIIIVSLIFSFFAFMISMMIPGKIIYGIVVSAAIVACGTIAAIISLLKKES